MRLHSRAVILLLLAGGAGSAHALDVGECGPMADMTAKLKAEGQQSIAFASTTADRAGTPTATTPLRGLIFSANASGSVGYTLQTNDPLDFSPTQMCVYNRMANVRVYDVRRPGTPPEVLSKASDAEGTRKCQELLNAGKTKECRLLNTVLALQEAVGQRVMIQGDYVRKQPDGSYAPDGIRVTVTAGLDESVAYTRKGVGAIHYSTKEGATIIDWVFTQTKYSDVGEKRLANTMGR
jgi:hypothetical protein